MQIARRSRAELKQYFVKNAIPTESNFAELIDGMLSQKDDGIAKLPNDPLSIEAAGDDTSQKKAIHFYNNFSDANPTWVLSLNPRQDPANAATARAGFSISDGAGNSRLFIERSSGNVGLGTVGPLRAGLHIDRGATNNLGLMLSSSGGGWGSGLQLENTAAGNAKTFGIYAGGGALHFADVNANADRMLITKDGDVGIGIAPSAAKLHVAGAVRANRFMSDSTLVLNDYTTVNPASNVFLYSQPNDRDAWLYLDSADTGSNWGIYHRQIDTPVKNLPGNSLGFIGGGSKLQAYISLADGSAYFAGRVDAPSGGRFQMIGIGSQFYGTTTFPYETIQMEPTTNLRVWYGTTERFIFGNGGFFQAGAFRGAAANWNTLGTDGTVMVDNVGYKSMMIVGSNQNQGKGRWVRLWDYLTVHGGIFADGEIESASAFIKVRGAGSEQAYMGGDGGGGDVQIGSTNPGIMTVIAWNTAVGVMDFTCRKLNQISDARLKENIVPLTGALDKVSRLRGVWFDWKSPQADTGGTRDLGLLAQEVKAVVPEAVNEGRGGHLAINYQAITVLLLEAVKEQQQQLDELRGALKEPRPQRKKGQ